MIIEMEPFKNKKLQTVLQTWDTKPAKVKLLESSENLIQIVMELLISMSLKI